MKPLFPSPMLNILNIDVRHTPPLPTHGGYVRLNSHISVAVASVEEAEAIVAALRAGEFTATVKSTVEKVVAL